MAKDKKAEAFIANINAGMNDAENVVEQKRGVKLTFSNYTLEDMRDRGVQMVEGFDGPDFKDIVGYQLSNEWVAVMTKDGSTYAYRAVDIARVKHYVYTEQGE